MASPAEETDTRGLTLGEGAEWTRLSELLVYCVVAVTKYLKGNLGKKGLTFVTC